LDSHFGIKALVQETDKMLKLKATQDILANQGFDLADLIEALGAVREMAVATYSPGFETRNIEEMNSIFSKLRYDFLDEYEDRKKEIAKKESQIKEYRVQARQAKLTKMMGADAGEAIPGGPPKPPAPADDGEAAVPLAVRLKNLEELKKAPHKVQHVAFVAHFKSQAADAAASFKAMAKQVAFDKETKTKEAPLHPEIKKAATCISPDNFFTIDSDEKDLYELGPLIKNIKKSGSMILLLSREVFEQPLVCLELCVAKQLGMAILPVTLEWPATNRGGRDFRFPYDLELWINDLSMYMESRGITEHNRRTSQSGPQAQKKYQMANPLESNRGAESGGTPGKPGGFTTENKPMILFMGKVIDYAMLSAGWIEERSSKLPWLQASAADMQEWLVHQRDKLYDQPYQQLQV